MKESRISAVGIWWSGSTGGVTKGGDFVANYRKPDLPFIQPYDTFACFPNAGHGDIMYNYKTHGGVATALDVDEIEHLNRIIEATFPSTGGGGGSGGGGVKDIIANETTRELQVRNSDGSAVSIPMSHLKATEFLPYLDVMNPNPANFITVAVALNAEVRVPIGLHQLQGRNLFMTVDRVNHRIVLPEGGCRGKFTVGIPFRFNPSVKDAMAMDVMWYCRKLGSADAWALLHKTTQSRTATQTTAAFNISTSMPIMDMPDYPVEVELRIKFTNIGTTGIKWGAIKLFNAPEDSFGGSFTKRANYPYYV